MIRFVMPWVEILIAINALSGALIGWLGWRLWRAKIREQSWLDSLRALSQRDYKHATVLAKKLQEHADTASVERESAYTLTRLIKAFENAEEREREQSQARRELENILAALQDAVLVVDREARVRFLNSQAAHLFELNVAKALGLKILEALPSLELESAVMMALEEERMSASEMQMFTPHTHELFVRVTPLRNSKGSILGAVVILQNITELRRLERVRRDFVANASHELRTPIATVRAMVETIIDSPEDPELVSRFLPQVAQEAERLSRLVNDLLDLTRIESSSPRPMEAVNLPIIIENVVQSLADKAKRSEIAVRCEFAESEGAEESQDSFTVLGDEDALEQVVFNLLDNALAYTSSGGTVTLRLAYGSKSNDGDSPATVTLSVSDTGIGIPAEELPRIFERFYRADKARSRAQGGTGLGLAIVKHIVDTHQGHIQVESEARQGTTFTVVLPAG